MHPIEADASEPAEPQDVLAWSRRLREQARAARSELLHVMAGVRQVRDERRRGAGGGKVKHRSNAPATAGDLTLAQITGR